jgi:hypothetical protein
MRFLQSFGDKRIGKETIDMRQAFFPRIRPLDFDRQRMIEMRKVFLQMVFRVHLVKDLLGIVPHVLVPLLPFPMLSAKFTHWRTSYENTFP